MNRLPPVLPYLYVIAIAAAAQNLNLQAKPPKPGCRLEVESCHLLDTTTKCLGATLPYRYSSQVLAADSDNESQVVEKLALWAGIQNVPRCWDVIQPFLCSVYLPRCYTEGNISYIGLPGVDLCEQTRQPCKVVDTYSGWPDFLQCNSSYFPPGCSVGNPARTLSFNLTSTCERPLVKTDNKNSWYQDIDGCGVQCQNPLFTEEEHHKVHIFIAVFGSLCMACTLFTVLSFIIDWKNANRYPALILFFINACFFMGSVGWMAQFIPGARKDIVCRSDGTMRTAEPQLGSGETASCTVVFILVYYFMIAGVTWFVILSYAWHLTFKALDYPRDAIEGKRGHFHLVAWSFPLVLTIVCLALSQVDGDSVSGICFVGYLNHTYRGFFVLLPVGMVMVIGAGFLISGLVTLIKMKMETPGLISDKASAKIQETIIRLGVFASFAVGFVIVTFCVHAYIFTNEPLWKKSFEDYIICEANVTIAKTLSTRPKTCTMKSRPNLVAMEIHMFAYFGAGIVMSSWVWNKATLLTWRRFLRKKFLNKEDEEPNMRLRKHEIIAQAFSKRREMNDGRISLSFYSTHDDPIGMKFDMNSMSSMEMSSAWAAAIPRMIMRRGGMAVPNTRRYSDSDVQSIQSTSFGVSGIIVESQSPRRNSMQSHGSHSLSHSEQEETNRKKKKKRRHRHRGSNRVMPVSNPAAAAGDQTSMKAGSIEAGSSLVPSSQCSRCTSLVSSSIDHPPQDYTSLDRILTDQQLMDRVPQPSDVVKVDIHVVSDPEDGEEIVEMPRPVDSDSMNSEDSVFTVLPDMEENTEQDGDVEEYQEPQHGAKDHGKEGESKRHAEKAKVKSDEEDERDIQSHNSAFKKYHRRTPPQRKASPTKAIGTSPPRIEAATPPLSDYARAAMQAHHHHTSSTYSMVTGYLPPGMMPEYAAPQPRYPAPPPGMYPGNPEPFPGMYQGNPEPFPGMYPGSPECYPGMHAKYPPPYSMNNYPMTFMPHDFFMSPPGFMPPPAYYPHPMASPHTMPPPHTMAPPHTMPPPFAYPMGSPNPMHNPYENTSVALPLKVEPVRYNPQKVEPVRYNRSRKRPTHVQPEPTEVDFPKRSKRYRDNSTKRTMAFDNAAFEPPSPTIKSKAQVLSALDGNHHHADLRPSHGSPKFSSSLTWHLDHVELASVSDHSA